MLNKVAKFAKDNKYYLAGLGTFTAIFLFWYYDAFNHGAKAMKDAIAQDIKNDLRLVKKKNPELFNEFREALEELHK